MSGSVDLLTLDKIDHSITINCGISERYAAQWSPVAAFRELVQNWRDGIIRAFDIPKGSLQVTCKEDNDQIIYKATSQEGQHCLGYIRWSRIMDIGTVDILNRGATLQPWNLDMGGTSKQDEPNQAGAHGEGLKIAILVLMRQPQYHAVRCYSGGCWWSFYFDSQRKLVCHISRSSPPRDQFGAIYDVWSQADRETNGHHFLSPHVSTTREKTVQIFIDARGRDEKGFKLQKEVTRDEFKAWTKAALFLQEIDTENIVTTDYGDLILDPRFGGNVYMKGLLLKESAPGRSASITGKTLRYGYNFANGAVNRERESMAAADEESRTISTIWAFAVHTKGDLIGKLHDLLNSREPEYADVAKADRFTQNGGTLAIALKVYLRTQFDGKWIYTSTQKRDNLRFDNIVQGLGYEPFEVKESYWKILKNNGFQTAAEAEKQKFQQAPAIRVPDHVFAQSLDHLVRAGLKSCFYTRNIAVEFVQAGLLGLDSFYSDSDSRLKIHEKWLTEAGATEELGLSEDILMYSLLFNAARRLLTDTILQIPLVNFRCANRTNYWAQKKQISRVDQRILEYTQIKKDLRYTITAGGMDLDTLTVEWNPTTGRVPDSSVEITALAEESCLHWKEAVTAVDFHHSYFNCGSCHTKTLPFKFGKCEFQVDKGKAYFVAFCVNAPGSIVVFSDKPDEPDELDELDELDEPAEPQVSMGVKRAAPTSTLSDESKIFTLGDSRGAPHMRIPRNWYKGSNSTGTRAVIGIATEDDPLSVSKRQRTG